MDRFFFSVADLPNQIPSTYENILNLQEMAYNSVTSC